MEQYELSANISALNLAFIFNSRKNKLTYNIVQYISSKSLYFKNLIWLEKMSMIFGFNVKKQP